MNQHAENAEDAEREAILAAVAPSWFYAAQRHPHPPGAPSFEPTRAPARNSPPKHLSRDDDGLGTGHAEAASARLGKSAGRFMVAGLVGFNAFIGILLYFGEGADRSSTAAAVDGKDSLLPVSTSSDRSRSQRTASGSISIVDATRPVTRERLVPGRSDETAVQGGGRFSGSERLLGASLDHRRSGSHASEIPPPETGSQGSGAPAPPGDGDETNHLVQLEKNLANQLQLSPAEKDILRDLAQRGSDSKTALYSANAKPSRAATGMLSEQTQRAMLSEDTSAEIPLLTRPVAPANYQKSSRVPSASGGEAQAHPTYAIQLVSVSTEQTAHRVWEAYRRDFASVLADLEPVIERVRVEGGTFYRVRTGPFPNRANADAVCALLKQRRADCLVFRR